MLRPIEPSPQPVSHPSRAQSLPCDVLGQEVVGHEVLQVAANLVLALRNDRRMRDRQTQRMPEERGHGEPVSKRTDHGCLRAGIDITPAAGVIQTQGHGIDRCGQDEQRQRDQAHPPKSAAALLIGRGRREETHG